jgi:hypothetical protein
MSHVGQVPSKKTIILVGLLGCLLTSAAGITGSMLLAGWGLSGGWPEWIRRLATGYPCASLVVWLIFPTLIPRMTHWLEARRSKNESRLESW